MLERSHWCDGGTLTGRRVVEMLRGITLGTITLATPQGMKLHLEWISTLLGKAFHTKILKEIFRQDTAET